MIIVNIWIIVLAPIIILIVDTKSALIPKIILAYESLDTVQVLGVVLVCAI